MRAGLLSLSLTRRLVLRSVLLLLSCLSSRTQPRRSFRLAHKKPADSVHMSESCLTKARAAHFLSCCLAGNRRLSRILSPPGISLISQSRDHTLPLHVQASERSSQSCVLRAIRALTCSLSELGPIYNLDPSGIASLYAPAIRIQWSNVGTPRCHSFHQDTFLLAASHEARQSSSARHGKSSASNTFKCHNKTFFPTFTSRFEQTRLSTCMPSSELIHTYDLAS